MQLHPVRCLLLPVLALVLCAAPLEARQPPPPALHGIVTLLRAHHVPLGLILPPGETGELQDGRTSLPAHLVSDRAALIAWIGMHGGPFRADDENGVLHIRSVEEPELIGHLLAREIHLDRDEEMRFGVTALVRLVSLIAPEPDPGFAGSGLSGCPLERPLRLPAGRYTVASYLDAIVRHVPGSVWTLRYNPEAPGLDVNVSLSCDGSTVGVSHVNW